MDRILAEFADVSQVPTTAPGGTAWRARDTGDDRWVLIKRLPESYGKARPTHALGLSHPRIVPMRRWLQDSGYLYIVRDWLPGRSLRETLAEPGSRFFDRLRALLDPILDALEYAHRAGQAHGAVTPENVLVGADGNTVLSDFGMSARRNGSRGSYAPQPALMPDGQPTPRADFYCLCEVYKEFLPDRTTRDEAGSAARTRLLRNLSEVQSTTADMDELRYKLDAVTRIAELLGFCSNSTPQVPRVGPKLVCQITPATAVLAAGSGASELLTVWNEGDEPLHVETVTSDVVWLNYHTRFTSFTIPADGERDLPFTLSAARLQPGAYTANLSVRSNHGMHSLAPAAGKPWHQHVVSLPVLITGKSPDQAPPQKQAPPIDRLSPDAGGTPARAGGQPLPPAETSGIACIQDPDPGVVRYGQTGVLHVGVKNIGDRRLRIDRVKTFPGWVSYPGDFEAVWIDPDCTQFLGFIVAANTLRPGDYQAEVTFATSTEEDTGMAPRTVWRELRCTVRVRVVRPFQPGSPPIAPAGGCAGVITGVLVVGAGLIALTVHLVK